MRKLVCILTMACLVLFTGTVQAADVSLAWNSSEGATGYRIQMTTDNGLSWSAGVDVGAVTSYMLLDVPDSGLVLLRVGAYNAQGDTINTWAGAWYNGDWLPPKVAGGLGVQ